MREHIVINSDRSVTVPDSLKKIGIQYDHNVNTLTFDCPRYADDAQSIDMSKMQIFINWMLPDKSIGCSIAENIIIDEADSTLMHFDWIITSAVTPVFGILERTLVCIKQTDNDGREIYHWNTDLFQKFSVGEGMECNEQLAEENMDVITQLLVKMDAVDTRTSTEAMRSYVSEYMTENPPQPSDEQANAGVDAYMTENGQDYVNTYMGENAQSAVNTYMDVNAQSKVNTYMEENAQEHIDTYMEQNAQNKVDDYLERNPLQLDNTLTDPTKAAPADKVGEIGTEVDELKGDLIDIEDTIDIHKNYVDSSIFNTGYYSLSDSGVINKNDSNTSYKKYKLEAVPSGNYMVLNLRGIFCIVEDLVTGAKRKLATTDTYINGLITLANRSNVYLTINSSVDKTYFVSGNMPVPTYVNKVGVYSYALEDNVKPTIYVEKNGTGDFTTIKEALEYALVHPFTTIYVGNGVYDLIDEIGSDYFSNFNGGGRAGLKLDNYVHVIFASNAKVICNYTGDNDKVKKDFSPFNTIADGKQQKGFILENLNLECSNVRYAIHDETSGQVNPYRNIYKNCHIVLDNSNNTQGYQQCIGGGLGSSAEIVIENCYFESIHADQTYDIVSYHNGGNGKSNIVITGCYFAGKDRCRCSNYGTSTEVSTMMVSNCSLGAEPRIIDEVSGANQNMRLIKWNNEVRTN